MANYEQLRPRCRMWIIVLTLTCLVEVTSNGIFDLNGVKEQILQWKNKKLNTCPSNSNRLMYLLNLACSSAQPVNVTARDACYNCFARVTSMPEGPQILSALSICAIQYFANTSYALCGNRLLEQATSGTTQQQGTISLLGTAACFTGYCDFVRCIRRVNSNSVIIQCTRESRTGVNITLDADNVRYFKNVTSCILAKARCGNFNPITGEPQTPGQGKQGSAAAGGSSVPISNTLQVAAGGDLRVLAFPASSLVTNAFCSLAGAGLTQTTWLNNVC